jgi:hypothetical protein
MRRGEDMSLVKIADDAAQTAKRNEVYDLLLKDYPADCLKWVKEATWQRKKVSLAEINMSRRPGGRNMGKVEKIAQAIQDGQKMGPVVLVKQSTGKYQVADGYHRTLGFDRAGKASIDSWVANTGADDGPWDEEMHAKKLNVEPGKKAGADDEGIAKLAALSHAHNHVYDALLDTFFAKHARQLTDNDGPTLQKDTRTSQILRLQRTKELQAGMKKIQDVRPGSVKAPTKDIASLLGRGFGKMAEEGDVYPRLAALAKEARGDIVAWEAANKTASEPVRDRQYYLDRVSKKQDKNGWYVYTHRCRSKSYPSIDDIPISKLQFVESTG